MTSFVPLLDLLPSPQRLLWSELSEIPRPFVLYGGTAIALRLGHRASVDFDFFSEAPLDHASLRSEAAFLAGATVLQEEKDALTVTVDRTGPVKVSFFGSITFGRVGVPEETDDGILRVASLLDLGGTKIKALLQRVEAKDYLDIAALLGAGVSLAEILGAAQTLFGPAFNPLVAQKTLSYFESGDFSSLDPSVTKLLTAEAARRIDVPSLPRLSSSLR